MATIIITCTEGDGTTLLVLMSSGSVFHTLCTIRHEDHSCGRRYWRNVTSRHVQTYELVLYVALLSQITKLRFGISVKGSHSSVSEKALLEHIFERDRVSHLDSM